MDAESVTVFVNPGTTTRVSFPRSGAKFFDDLRAGVFRTSTAIWPEPGDRSGLESNFKVAFSSAGFQDTRPLFSIDGDCARFSLDLLVSTVLTLSRFEETLPGPRDQHGRFSAFSSVAWRDGFLDRPIVDEFGLGLEMALRALLPGWQPLPRRLRVKLGIDVDEIGIPFSLRTSVGHCLRRRRPEATVRDLVAAATGVDTFYQKLLREMVSLAVDRNVGTAVYWKASTRGRHDTGYDPRDRRIVSMIESFRRMGVEIGIHPGYETFQSMDALQREVSILEELLPQKPLGGRQDFLRWNPQMWVSWESLGLAYDASVGFADHVGFRAGTCFPYTPWLLAERREAQLLEIPLMAMDATLEHYMKLDGHDALGVLRDCVRRCRSVGGVFSTLWHNTKFIRRSHRKLFRALLDELAGTETFEHWQTADGAC